MLCIISIFFLFAVFLMTSPIRLSDTDLWYHLAGGRFLIETGMLANPYDVSFIEPKMDSANYFWGFQLLVYSIWNITGYLGLILMKAILLLSTAWFMTKIMIADNKFSTVGLLTITIVSLAIFLLGMRSTGVRPHLFSYFFIAFFIFILQYRSRWLPALPLMTIMWINIHGIEWVIGALICGSYGLHQLLQYQQDRDVRRIRQLFWIIACIPAMLVNPHGIYILAVPFSTPVDINYFVTELQPVDLRRHFDSGDYFLYRYAFPLLALFSLIALVYTVGQFRKHIFALLLFSGGLILLSRGMRFIWEWLILSTPLFAVGLDTLSNSNSRIRARQLAIGFLIPTLLGYTWWQGIKESNSQYPFDEDSLPRGTTDFIYNLGLSGKYAAPPALVGYIEWRLTPENVEIHSDMQFPPFTSEVFFEILQSMYTAIGHQHLVDKYTPDLISVGIGNSAFSRIVSDQFVPVFFDQKLVLYLNRDTYPAIAKEHQLLHIDPFKPNMIQVQYLQEGIKELKRMLEVTDQIPGVKAILAGFLIESGNLDEAKIYLDSLRGFKPELERVAFFTAKIAHLEEDYPLAIDHYLRALSMTAKPNPIRRLLGECYFHTGDLRQAYNYFKDSVNPYSQLNVSLLDYYLFALTSYAVGDNDRSQRLIHMFRSLDDGENPDLTRLVEDLDLSRRE